MDTVLTHAGIAAAGPGPEAGQLWACRGVTRHAQNLQFHPRAVAASMPGLTAAKGAHEEELQARMPQYRAGGEA
jgi:hypothetical protein